MFIEIKNSYKDTDKYIDGKNNSKHYINIFKITSIENYINEDNTKQTRINYTCGADYLCVFTNELIEDFMKRLKKETNIMAENINSRFDILDL